MISVSINGKQESLQNGITVAELIQQINLTGKRIAMELNGEIVPRSQFSDRTLKQGDKLEIIVAVGGG
jgi:sulfur carrier protein